MKWKIILFIGLALVLIVGGFFMFNKEDVLFSYLNPLSLLGIISASESLGNCDTISTANTIFVLNESLTNTGATCLTISAQNITIDCNGFNITGDNTASTYGIVSNQVNTSVKNCIISGYVDAVRFNSGADFGNITNNTLISILGTSGGGGAGEGLFIASGADYNNVSFNNATDINNNGITISGQNNTLVNNTGNSVSFYGIDISGGFRNNLTNNYANSTSNIGLRLELSAKNNWGTNNKVVSGSNTALTLRGGTSTCDIANNIFHYGDYTSGTSNDNAVDFNRNTCNNTITNSVMYATGTGRTINFMTSEYNNTFINNTLITTGTGNLVNINPASWGNLFYANDFTYTTGLYINDSNSTGANYFNLTEGNIYPEVFNETVSITGVSSSAYHPELYIGNAGTGYPYNSTTSLGKVANATDYAPLTPTSGGEPPANCWTNDGTLLFIPTGCVYTKVAGELEEI